MRSDLVGRKQPEPKPNVKECQERVRKNPKDLEARVLLGMTYRLQGDFAAAIETWKGILEIDPAYAPAKGLIRSVQAELMKIKMVMP